MKKKTKVEVTVNVDGNFVHRMTSISEKETADAFVKKITMTCP